MENEPSADLLLEIDLVERIGRGDRQSFEQLYERFSGVLFSTAYRILNDQEGAEDVLQDVFVQIWDKASMYDSKRGKPLTWAVTLTRNKAIDRLRSVQRRNRLNDEVEEEASIDAQIHSEQPVDAVEAMEKSRLIRSAVLQLSKEQREAIELAFFTGLTQNEIADELKQPLGTVKARIRRGMMKLKELVEPYL
jgi:RNA polymerase sigma-70 factor (ECF subfamily)